MKIKQLIVGKLDENCYISLIVIGELENIKTSAAKDEEVKQAARKVVNIIKNSKCLTTVFSKKDYDSFMKKYSYALFLHLMYFACIFYFLILVLV